MKLAYFPLKNIPQIEITSLPSLSQEERFYLQAAEKTIVDNPYFFNGETLHVKEANDQKLELFPATYAWSLAQKKLPGLGGLSVSLLLKREDGAYLWQERSERVTLPHHWDFAAGGTVADTDLEDEIRKEALEELGQSKLPGLQLEALALIPKSKIELLFSAQWSGEELKANDEISRLHWGPEPPWPSLRGTRLVFRAFLKN